MAGSDGLDSCPTGAAAAGRPRDTRIDEAVLAATRELIVEVGYTGLTFTEVAARAGTSVPAIRRRWPSKVHLVHRVVFPTDVVIPDRDPDESLDVVLQSVVDGCAGLFGDHAMRLAITGVFCEVVADPELQGRLTAPLRDAALADLAERLRLAAVHDGVDVHADASLVMEVAFGGTLMAVMLRGADGLDDAWRADLVDVLRHIVLR